MPTTLASPFRTAFLTCLLVLFTTAANAHRPGESYIYLNATEESVSGRVELTLNDLNRAFSLDKNGDQNISKEKLKVMSEAITSEVGSRLTFFRNDARHPVTVSRTEVRDYGVAEYALVFFNVPTLSPVPEQIDVQYRYLLNGFEPTHRSLLVIESNTRTGTVDNESQVSLIFGPNQERQTLSLVGTPWYKVFYAFVKHGVWHIWIGFDHILFIVALLLPSVMMVRDRQWTPVDDFRTAFIFVVKIVTLFTIAHSVTLSLAALKIIELPSRLVESIIALSIIAVAFNNIAPRFERYVWIIVFGFGLFHGLGFANVLAPLGIERASLAASLFGFNVGVEIGQLVIVAVVFPVLFLLRNWRFYPLVVLRAGSGALLVVAGFWFYERALGV